MYMYSNNLLMRTTVIEITDPTMKQSTQWEKTKSKGQQP
jgi:hypothetical protein